jgi:thiamine biosynthesis lipoprotein
MTQAVLFHPDAEAEDFEFQAMACPCVLHLAGEDTPQARVGRAAAAEAAIAEVRRIEAKYSRYRDDSVLSQINAAAGDRRRTAIDSETAQLLAYADRLYWSSDGLFDISSGVLRRAWNFKRPALPDKQLLKSLLACVAWPEVEWDDKSVRLPHRGMELDFGGFGKEYAADRAAALLLESGVTHGYVNLGGDIRVLGPRPDGRPWRLGVQHPRRPDTLATEIPLSHGALATSGDYERYFELDGQRYCHILHPRTGYPVRYWQSVSVAAALCSAAGALCTIAMLQEERGLQFLAGQGETFFAIDRDGRSHRQDFNHPSAC